MTLTPIGADLFETRTDTLSPKLTTHSYLWRRPGGNLLFYSPATTADFDAIAELGGVAAQYLSHRDEAGPNLVRVAERFGSKLHAPAAELADVEKFTPVDVPLPPHRHVDDNGVDVIPTPGHSPGSTCYLITGTDGTRYLFTGDTMFSAPDGTWSTLLIPGRGDPDQLTASLRMLANEPPDVVISSAFHAVGAVERVSAARWAQIVDEALGSVAQWVRAHDGQTAND